MSVWGSSGARACAPALPIMLPLRERKRGSSARQSGGERPGSLESAHARVLEVEPLLRAPRHQPDQHLEPSVLDADAAVALQRRERGGLQIARRVLHARVVETELRARGGRARARARSIVRGPRDGRATAARARTRSSSTLRAASARVCDARATPSRPACLRRQRKRSVPITERNSPTSAHGLRGKLKSPENTATVAATSSATPLFAAAAAATAGSTSAIDREGDGATRKEDLQTLSTWTPRPPGQKAVPRGSCTCRKTTPWTLLSSLAAVGVALAVSARAAPRQIALETPGPSDVLLASFPKSGNDWARFLVGRLLAARARRRRRPRLPQPRGRRPRPRVRAEPRGVRARRPAAPPPPPLMSDPRAPDIKALSLLSTSK